MPWLRLDDAMGEHRKVRRTFKTTRTGVALHLMGLLHCARYLTDGFVEDAFVAELCHDARIRDRERDAALSALEENEMWKRADGGWEVHDYLAYNPSRSQTEARRRKDAARKAQGRGADSDGSPNGIQAESARTDSGVRSDPRGRTRTPSRPVPSRPDQSREADASLSSEPSGFDPQIIGLCNLLADLIRKRDPKAKVASESKGWLTDMDRLVRLDDRTPAEVRRIIEWCQADSFWQANILSPGKLRERFTALALKANTVPSANGHDADAEAAKWAARGAEWAREDAPV